MRLTGLDHADIRVRSIAEVEQFYDALLPALGLRVKMEFHVAPDDEIYDIGPGRPRNVIEYHTPAAPGERYWFVGFIEESSTAAVGTRIAFALEDESAIPEVEALLRRVGARVIEPGSETYPAIFFEDPIGTRLEICARRPKTGS
jgi:catechol 2,3-dioxygenase-like lactoylglutathione lyase family enzyme